MNDRLQHFEYNITTDQQFIFDKFGIPPELQVQLESLRTKAPTGGKRIIRKLNSLIEQFPHVPHLKNYLSVAYEADGMKTKGFEVNQQIIREHPDYLFGKINLAFEYYFKEQYDKIPEVLGRSMELKALYPERECFHLTEVTSFLKIAIIYFCATGNLKAAEPRYDIMDELAPDHPDTKAVVPYIIEARLNAGIKRMEEERKTRIRVKTGSYDKKVQTQTPPEFIHREINWLYENSLDIESKKLEKILSLPRNELISDLTAVVRDSIARYEYFSGITDKEGWQEDKMNFSVHAIFLLGELRASQCLPLVLETFRQGKEFIYFWYGDLMTGELWEPLYYLGENQLYVLKEFVLSPGIWTYARARVCFCVAQIAHHRPGRRKEVTQWFRDVFKSLAKTLLKENVIDSDFIGIAIWDAKKLCDPALLPEIKDLLNLGYVNKEICGTFEKIESDITTPAGENNKESLMNIHDRYRHIVTTC